MQHSGRSKLRHMSAVLLLFACSGTEPPYLASTYPYVPDQAAFYPERVACRAHFFTEEDIKKQKGMAFFVKIASQKSGKEKYKNLPFDYMMSILRFLSDSGDSRMMRAYAEYLIVDVETKMNIAKMNQDAQNKKYDNENMIRIFEEKFHDITVLTMTYAYIPFLLHPDENPPDRLMLGIAEGSARKAPRAWVTEAKAAGDRWKYLCDHPAERQAAIEKSDALPLCPQDTHRDRRVQWPYEIQWPSSLHEQDLRLWRNHSEIYDSDPAPHVSQCLPRPPEAPEIHTP